MAIEKNSKMNFKDEKSLTPVKNILNEASLAVSDKSRTIAKSPVSKPLAAAAAIGTGGALSFAALAGISVASMPVLIAGGPILGGFLLYQKAKKLKQEKELCYKEAIKKQNEIITALKEESSADKERIEYLNAINKLLEAAIRDLKADLEMKQGA